MMREPTDFGSALPIVAYRGVKARINLRHLKPFARIVTTRSL